MLSLKAAAVERPQKNEEIVFQARGKIWESQNRRARCWMYMAAVASARRSPVQPGCSRGNRIGYREGRHVLRPRRHIRPRSRLDRRYMGSVRLDGPSRRIRRPVAVLLLPRVICRYVHPRRRPRRLMRHMVPPEGKGGNRAVDADRRPRHRSRPSRPRHKSGGYPSSTSTAPATATGTSCSTTG